MKLQIRQEFFLEFYRKILQSKQNKTAVEEHVGNKLNFPFTLSKHTWRPQNNLGYLPKNLRTFFIQWEIIVIFCASSKFLHVLDFLWCFLNDPRTTSGWGYGKFNMLIMTTSVPNLNLSTNLSIYDVVSLWPRSVCFIITDKWYGKC